MRYMTRLLLICLSFIPILCLGQNALSGADNFSGKTLVFVDSFNDDRNGWIRLDKELDKTKTPCEGDDNSFIKDGLLVYEGNALNNVCALFIEPDIDYTRNFEIEVSAMVFLKGKKYTDQGAIVWARDTASYAAGYLYFDERKGYNFSTCSTKDKYCKFKLFFRAGKEKSFNKIVIRHIADKYYIIVNDSNPKAFPYQPPPGNALGLGGGNGATVFFDYIRVSYLNE